MQKFFILFFLLSTYGLFAEIRQSHTTQEVLQWVVQYDTADTLVIFDIDNTILAPTQALGSDMWFYAYLHELREKMDKQEALHHAVSLLHQIYERTQVKLIEENTPAVIETLQRNGHSVIALTTRSRQMADCTIRHLHSLGIDMTKTAPTPDTAAFADMPRVLWKEGVVLTSGEHKGKALLAFLHHCNIRPKAILFINDKESHIQEMEGTIEATGITFLGLRYSAADVAVQNYRHDVAAVQLAHFHGILPDELCASILSHNLHSTQN